MDPVTRLEETLAAAPAAVEGASGIQGLKEVEEALLGERSAVGEVRRAIGRLDARERPVVGAKLHEVTAAITDLIERRRANLEEADQEERIEGERLDLSFDSVRIPRGHHHLITQTIDEVVDIFVGLGYAVASGPEADLAWYNFDALNTPPTHPARLESDTMYLDYGDPVDEALMRAHTSTVQVRWMESHPPPVHIVVPGRAYRLDTIDASHLPVFFQIEGLAVDTDINFSHLKGTLAYFAKEFLGPSTEVRLRPSFFPFTEPSAELDVSCFACDGNDPGCRVCKGVGWLEMLGCGMVDPNVLEAVGYDPTRVSGFAFGMGVERLAMVRHGIDSIRHFVDNDLRFLEQF